MSAALERRPAHGGHPGTVVIARAQERRNRIVSVRIPRELDEDVTRLAKAQGMTFSDAARAGLRLIGVFPPR